MTRIHRLWPPLGAAVLCWFAAPPASCPVLPVAPACPVPTVVRWCHGDPARRLIPAGAGFCYLSAIGGAFEGGGEAVRVFVDDGSWWVAGRSCQPSLWVEVTCVRWSPAGGQERGGHPPSVR